MDPRRHALYMRPFRHLCDHTPFADVLQDVLEDVFGLPPRPHIDGHEAMSSEPSHGGGDPKNKDEDGGAQNWDEDYYLEILGERGGGITKSYCFLIV